MAWRFDGTNGNNIDTLADYSVSASEGYVMGCVFRTFSTAYTGTTWAAIMGGTQLSSTRLMELAIGNTGFQGADNGGFFFAKYISTTHQADLAAGTLADRRWHSLVGGRRASGEAYVCLDGNVPVTGGTDTTALAVTETMTIGDRGQVAQQAFDGDITNAIFSIGPDLSDGQIQRLGKHLLRNWMGYPNDIVRVATSGKGGIWYRGGPNKAIDTSGLANHGDMVGSVFRVADPPFFRRRKLIVRVPAAAGGNAMPMAMNHYRRRRAG